MEAAALRVELNEFVWHELYTRDINGAADFYTYVVGWRILTPDGNGIEEPGYRNLLASGVPVGAITKDESPPGALPPYWSAYVHTPDIHETRRRVEKLDGDLLGDIFEIGGKGHAAGLIDTAGALLWVLQPEGGGAMPRRPSWGSFTWSELAAPYPTIALKFYEELFGWRRRDELDVGDGQTYRIFGKGGMAYGVIYIVPETNEVPLWLYYISVHDLDAALERVKERGGRVLNEPMELDGPDRFVRCADAQGGAFGLHETRGKARLERRMQCRMQSLGVCRMVDPQIVRFLLERPQSARGDIASMEFESGSRVSGAFWTLSFSV